MPDAALHTGTIVSIGYEGRTLDEFVDVLRSNGVEVLVDVRLTPISRKKGFSKTALSAALQAAGIEYRHEPALGNPKDNRDAFRRGLASARTRYVRHLSNGASSNYEATVDSARTRRVALLCFERDHSQCHRSCITERAQAEHPALSVVRA
ncbi:MAG: DUF488 family protein [Microthrixaceae bacterium]